MNGKVNCRGTSSKWVEPHLEKVTITKVISDFGARGFKLEFIFGSTMIHVVLCSLLHCPTFINTEFSLLSTSPAVNLICGASVGTVISQGINAGDVKKLQDAGIYTCNGLMMHTKKVLKCIPNLH